MEIRGRVRDIQPNQAQPTLELYFDANDRSLLPKGKREKITLNLDGERWHGTINSSGSNPPYVHTKLTQDFGSTSKCTEVLLDLGLAEGAVLRFACEPHKVLRLVEIVDPGKWRAGNEPGERTARSRSSSRRRRPATATRRRSSSPAGAAASHQGDVEGLAAALRRDFADAQPSTDRAWSRAPALRVIDCVLSLNRRYDGFVVPRLDRFERLHPKVTSVRGLRAVMDRYASPEDFLRDALDYNHPDRARILHEVVDFVLGIIGDAPAELEVFQLERWAKKVNPEDHVSLGISGFALAGFQYLRMLFGANTTKPDTHIRAYVEEAVGHGVSDLEALNLLEAAAAREGISLRDADTNIWEKRARG